MWSLAEIAQHVDGHVVGDADWQVDSVATLMNAQQHQISFLANSKYKKHLASTQAGAVLITERDIDAVPYHAVVVKDSYVAYAKVATLLNPEPESVAAIAPSAIIHDSVSVPESAVIAAHVVIEQGVELGENAHIGPGTVIQYGTKIGDNARIAANVTICHGVEIGNNVIIHPGVVIGADGFGLANDQGKWIKIPQVGTVEIGHDVEIGANTTIDRGALENTVIGHGVKLDNQIQLGHNDVIGDNTVIAGCTGIAGSVKVGKNCIIGGAVGISGHIEIADGVVATGMTMITKSITESGVYSSGIPAEPASQWHKNTVRYRQLGKLAERVKKLERKA